MNTSIRHTASYLCLAMAASAAPAFAQNAAPAQGGAPATMAATGYGANAQAPVNRRATQRSSEQALLGAPDDYSSNDTQQGNTDDAQRTALTSEQRMTVLGGQGAQPAVGKGQRKAAAANGPVRVAGQGGGQPNAADAATKATYADPYAAGKQAVYRSPW